MKTTLFVLFSAGLTLLPLGAYADSALAVGSSVNTFSAVSSQPGGPSATPLADTGIVNFTGYTAGSSTVIFTGTMDSQVYLDPSTGGLDFLYQISNTGGGSADTLERITMTNFTGFTTAVTYDTSSGTVAPSLATRQSGDVVGWSFDNAPLSAGTTTYWLEIDTNAKSYELGSLNVEDGGIATVAAFAPAPEPATMGLLGVAFTGLGLLRFRLRRNKK